MAQDSSIHTNAYHIKLVGSVRCGELWSGCAGAAVGTEWANNCYPNIAWSSSAQSSGVYWSPYLNGGSVSLHGACGTGYCPVSLAFSVRCVLVLKYFYGKPKIKRLHLITQLYISTKIILY